jgi:N-acyl homoserine lactone hydrolase
VMILGHDVPMVLGEEEVPQYIGTREPAISAWFGEHLETTTLFELSQ